MILLKKFAMKIAHVIIAAAYKEGYGYQENILPAKHVEIGLDTYIVTFDEKNINGKEYTNSDGVKIVMLPLNENIFKKIPILRSFIKHTRGLYNILNRISPDIIFVHNLGSFESLEVCRYCRKHKNVKLFVDQHADYYNSPITQWRKRVYVKTVFGYIGKKLEKYAIKFWGVTPWRVDYLQKVYGIKPEKTDLLVMGGDEKLIDWNNRFNIRKNIRNKYNIPQDAFLVISGGRIDKTKNIHLLIDAVSSLKEKNIYLLVFGSLTKDMEDFCTPKFKGNIKYAGWIDSKQVYPLFLASELAVFPGTHSVLWEQSIACGLPGIFKDWDGGFSHIDCGGNAILLKDITKDNLANEISNLLDDKSKYESMKINADNGTREKFWYINIAKRSIGL